MAITKAASATVDAWASVAQNAMREGTVFDVSLLYTGLFYVDVALTSATAHNGTPVHVLGSSAGSGDSYWTELMRVFGPAGTANVEAITNNPLAAGSTTITCASTTGYESYAGGYDPWRFILDGTVANSELVFQNGHTTNTNITIIDGTTTEHAVSTNMYSIARPIPVWLDLGGLLRVKFVVNNKYHAAGSSVATRTRLVEVTAL